MNTPAQDLIFLANRLARANAGELSFDLESCRVIRVTSYADNHVAARAYVASLPVAAEWSERVIREDGSTWRRLSAVVDGITFFASDVQPAVPAKVAA